MMKHLLAGLCLFVASTLIKTALAAENMPAPACSGQAQYNWAAYRGAEGNSVVHPANAFSVDCAKDGLIYSAAAMLRNPDNNQVTGGSMALRQASVSNDSGQATTWTAGMLHNATGIAGANHTFWYNAYPLDEPTVLVDWRSTVPLMIQQLIGVTLRHHLSLEKGSLELSNTLGWSIDSQFLIFGKRLAGYGLSAGRGVSDMPSFIGDATYVARDDQGGNWAVGIQGGRMAEGYNGLVAAESRIGVHVERTLMHGHGASTYFGGELYRMTNPNGMQTPGSFLTGSLGVIHTQPLNDRFSTYIAGAFNGNSIEGLVTSIEAGVRWNMIKSFFLTAATGYEKPLGGGLLQSDQFGFYGGMQYKFNLM